MGYIYLLLYICIMKKINFKGVMLDVYEDGRIFINERVYVFSNGKPKKYKRKEISVNDNGRGYKTINLNMVKKNYKEYVHRIVATAYHPNPNNLPEVNHKDGRRENNRFDNLEWCTRKENVMDYIKKGRAKYFSKSVLQFDKNGCLVKEYKSLAEAAKQFNGTDNNIGMVANGKGKTAFGYHWIFKKDYNSEIHTKKYIIDLFKDKYSKKVRMYKNGLFVKDFNSQAEAARYLCDSGKNTQVIKISECTRGVRKSYHGYTFELIN